MNLQIVILGNTLLKYVYAFGVFLLAVVIFKIFQFVILRKLQKIAKKTVTDIDDTLIGIVQSLKPPFYYFLAFYFATYFINISVLFKRITEGILLVLVVYQIVTATQILIDYIIGKRISISGDSKTNSAILNIGKILKFILWFLGILFIFSNFGINVTSLVAGLGIGGIAVAFALQNILSDLFSSFAIYFDKPFRVGDFIKIGSDAGTVEKIGIKTTRLRTTQGEEMVISNQELTSARIQNFKQMERRRGLFSFGVVYNTSVSKLKAIPDLVRVIIESVDGLTFSRAHFKDFGDSSLNFEIVYFVSSGDYGQFMNSQQEINLRIMEVFEEKGIEMAFPTRTIFIKKEN